jgi:hypothetical protein
LAIAILALIAMAPLSSLASGVPATSAVTSANLLSNSTMAVTVHSCPDDFVGTGFFQYETNCTSEIGLYGVPLKFVLPGGSTSYQYSQPSGSGTAQPMLVTQIGQGSLEIAEVSSSRIKESVVFCSQSRAGNGGVVLDGYEIQVTNGSAFIGFNEGDTADCDWYRFPGGIADEASSTPTAAADTMIAITKYICDPDEISFDENDLPENQNYDLQNSCHPSEETFTFTLDDHDSFEVDDFMNSGAWFDPSVGEHTIVETIPHGYGEPIVICDGSVAGVQYIRPNMFRMNVHNGGITYDLAANETLSCWWFNVLDDGQNGSSQHNNQSNHDELIPDATVEHNGNDVFLTNDSDDDGLLDGDELNTYGTNPNNEDSDGDGIGDGDEVMTIGTDPLARDTDIDGISDGDEEYIVGTNPNQNDSDFDGFSDGDELNNLGTDPLNADTDGDGVDDGDEIVQGTDPLKP